MMEITGVLVDEILAKSVNVAHSFARKAEESEQVGDVASAIEYHGQAAMMIKQFLDTVEKEKDSQANLSLELQFNYHQNRVKFLTAIDAYKVICSSFKLFTQYWVENPCMYI